MAYASPLGRSRGTLPSDGAEEDCAARFWRSQPVPLWKWEGGDCFWLRQGKGDQHPLLWRSQLLFPKERGVGKKSRREKQRLVLKIKKSIYSCPAPPFCSAGKGTFALQGKARQKEQGFALLSFSKTGYGGYALHSPH